MLTRQPEALALASRYLQCLSNPPVSARDADHAAAAIYLQQELLSHGVSSTILKDGRGGANLVARLPAAPAGDVAGGRLASGAGQRPAGADGALLLTAPLDHSYCETYYGHASPAAVFAALVAEAARTGMQPRRDIVLALTAERAGAGGVDSGLCWLTANHAAELRAAAALTGGSWHLRLLGKTYLTYQHAGLGRAVFRLVATGRAGQDCPDHRNPIILLGGALAALGQWECPIHVSPGFQACVEALAAEQALPAASYVRSLLNPLFTREAAARVSRDAETRNRLLAQASNTFRPTGLSAAGKQEGQPGSAETTIDCSLPPGQTAETARTELEGLLRARGLPLDEAEGCCLHILTTEEAPAVESPPHTELTRAMERAVRQLKPQMAIVPVMDAGDTPVRHLRALGIPTYGFFPVSHHHQQRAVTRHDGEPLSERALAFAVDILWDVLVTFAAGLPVAPGTAGRPPAQRS